MKDVILMVVCLWTIPVCLHVNGPSHMFQCFCFCRWWKSGCPFGVWDWELDVHFSQKQAEPWTHLRWANDSGFLKYSWAHVAIFHDGSYAMPSEGSKVMHIHLRFPALSLDSLNLYTILCVVVGERPFFAIMHWEMWFLISLTLLSWNLA